MPPKSPTNMWINSLGLIVSIAGLLLIRQYGKALSNFQAVILCLAAYALPIIIMELGFLKTHAYRSNGLDFRQAPSGPRLGRVAIKLIGFYATLALVAGVYWIFPEYQADFYDNYYALLRRLLPFLSLGALPYFFLVDRYMREPKDGYWQLGCLCLGQWQNIERRVIGQHLRAWIVKLFFLPLMYVYFTHKMTYMRGFIFEDLFESYDQFYNFIYNLVFYIDLLVVTVGYMCTIRLFDSHVRSTEPSFLGWFVALECYQPFWSFFSANYFAYDQGDAWGFWFREHATIYPIWGTLILCLVGIYVWASIAFGIRFSNLTHRGILTNGPYRYTKHPAYISKNLSWWLISMPFLSTVGPTEALRHSVLLIAVNIIYFLRAKTEERHLSNDPAYLDYAQYIEEKGLFSKVGRLFPAIRFKAGHLFNL